MSTAKPHEYKNKNIRHYRSCHAPSYEGNNGGGLTTVVGTYKDEQGKIMLRIGWSFCSPQDSFRKKTGSENAMERYADSPLFACAGHKATHKDITTAVMCALLCSDTVPRKSRYLIKVSIFKTLISDGIIAEFVKERNNK